MANANLSRKSGGWLPFLVAAAFAAALVLHGCKLAGYGAELTRISVSPGDATVASVTTQQFTATGTFSDDSQRDVTAEVDWASSAPSVAVVSGGLATPAGAGTATITASKDGVSGSAALTVTAALLESIEVTPGDASIANGTRLQLAATGHFDDLSTQDLTSQASWASSDPNVTVGDVAGSKGLAASTALGATTSTITATFDAVVGSTVLTVKAVDLDSLEVTPVTTTVTVLRYAQFAATGHFSDATTQVMTGEVAWTSSNTSVATIGATTGRARGIFASPTPVTITATSSALLGSKAGTAELTVQASSGGY